MNIVKKILVSTFLFTLLSFGLLACNPNPNEKKKVFEYDVVFVDYPSYNVKIKSNQTVSMPKEPEKDGFKFLGWFYNGNLFDFNTKINSDIIIEPKFIDIKPLLEQITEVEEKIKEENFETRYTKESIEELKNKLNDAKNYIKDKTDKRSATEIINTLRKCLVELVDTSRKNEKADKEALKEQINLAQAKKDEENFETKYTKTSKKLLEDKLTQAVKLLQSVYTKQSEVDKVTVELNNAILNLVLVSNENINDEIPTYEITLSDTRKKEQVSLQFKNLDTTGFNKVKGSDVKKDYLEYFRLNDLELSEFGIEMENGLLRVYIPYASIGDILEIKENLPYKAIKNNNVLTIAKSNNNLKLVYNGNKFIPENKNFEKANDFELSKDSLEIKDNETHSINYKLLPENKKGELQAVFDPESGLLVRISSDSINITYNKDIVENQEILVDIYIKNTFIKKTITVNVVKEDNHENPNLNLKNLLSHNYVVNTDFKLSEKYQNGTKLLFVDNKSEIQIENEFKNVSTQNGSDLVIAGTFDKNENNYGNFIKFNLNNKEVLSKLYLSAALFNKRDKKDLKDIRLILTKGEKKIVKIISPESFEANNEFKEFEIFLQNEEIDTYEELVIVVGKKSSNNNKVRIKISNLKLYKVDKS